MKVLEKKENGLYDISYYDKITKENVILNDVSEEVVKTLRKFKRDEDDYREERKKRIVSLDEYQSENYEFGDVLSNFEDEALFNVSVDRFKKELPEYMKLLTPRQQKVIKFKFFDKMKEKDIAKKLRVKQQAISEIYQSALKVLRSKMDVEIIKKSRKAKKITEI